MSAFVYSTLTDYQASRTSGEIYAVLNAAAPSATCTSFVTATGETFVDAVNVIVPRNRGAVGDLLVHSSSGGYQWVKTDVSSGYGKSFCDTSKLTAAGYTCIGYMAYRDGNEARIITLSDISTGVRWGDSEDVSGIGVGSSSLIQRRDRYATWIASCNEFMAERDAGAGGYYQYTYPLSRNFWDSVKAAFDSGAAAPSGSNGMSSSFSGGSVTITYAGTEGNVTINPKDYDWDFHKWYRKKIMALKDGKSYANADMAGARNTELLAARYSSSAAAVAHSYGIGITGFTAGKWWLPSCGEWLKIAENAEKLSQVGGLALDTWYWTSTQAGSSYAWGVNTSVGSVLGGPDKSSGNRVRAVAAFQIEN